MATHKSAEKRARQSVRKNARNTRRLGAVRTLEKKLRAVLGSADKSSATELMNQYMSQMSRAAAAGVVHARTASRKISRLAARVGAGAAAKK